MSCMNGFYKLEFVNMCGTKQVKPFLNIYYKIEEPFRKGA